VRIYVPHNAHTMFRVSNLGKARGSSAENLTIDYTVGQIAPPVIRLTEAQLNRLSGMPPRYRIQHLRPVGLRRHTESMAVAGFWAAFFAVFLSSLTPGN
jgi:hypothetical protein